ncbi:MAG: ABC transporter substrate-binding protein [Emergencia sp.]
MRNSKTAVRTAALGVMLAAALFMAAGCTTFDNFKEAFFSEKGAAADTVRIGVLEPQTGNDSHKGDLEIQGIELARELVPEVLGKEVELVYADTQSSIYVAETAVEDLIDKKPAVVLGSYGDAVSLVASRQLGEAKIPAITITATNPLITANNEYYFRVTFTDASQGSALAEFTYNYLQLEQAVVIMQKDDDSVRDTVNQFSRRLMELTEDENSVCDTIEVEKNAKKCDGYIAELKESGAGAAFMALPFSSAEKILKEAAKEGVTDVTFIGTKDWSTRDVISLQKEYPQLRIAVASDFTGQAAEPEAAAAGEKADVDQADAEAQADVNQADSEAQTDDSLYSRFLKAYKDKYGIDNPPEAAALGFDAYMIAVQAIENAQSIDGYLVKEALKTTTGFQGASGEISFNETGEPKKTINVSMVSDGSLVTVYTAR